MWGLHIAKITRQPAIFGFAKSAEAQGFSAAIPPYMRMKLTGLQAWKRKHSSQVQTYSLKELRGPGRARLLDRLKLDSRYFIRRDEEKK